MNTEIIKELDKILHVVERVHGEHHPELHEVAKLYGELKQGAHVADKLRQVTGNFTVPADACPTFAKTYADLEELTREL